MTVLILLAVVALAYVAYINRDRIKAALNKDDGLDDEPVAKPAPIVAKPETPNSGIANVPNTGTTVPNSAPTPGTITATIPIYNGTGEPPSQEAWAAWLATLDPMRRSYYPAIWKPTTVQPSGSGDTVPTFKPVGGNLVANETMTRGVRFLSTGSLGIVQSFPMEPGALRVKIAETSGTGDKVKYNLWISDSPAGVSISGDPAHEFQYNTATLIFTPSEKTLYANVRALVDGGRPFYIQVN